MRSFLFFNVLIAFVLFGTTNSAHAQWSFNGVKIFYNAGNVGIGTSNPAHKLDVRSAGSRAIYGASNAAAGTADGVYGYSKSTNGRGVVGYVDAETGFNYGVYGRSDSTKGRGVFGYAAASDGVNMGVYGKTNSPIGYAGYFDGNVGVTGWVGTKANAPIDIYSNNRRALRIVDAVNGGEISPNIIGGPAGNSVTAGVNGATIGGGGDSNNGFNRVTDVYGTVGGGTDNQAGNNTGTTSDAFSATVSGGNTNTASGHASTVGGGGSNTASGDASAIAGGFNNITSGHDSMVPGGQWNTAAGAASFAAGYGAKANHDGAFVWGDSTPDTITSSAADEMTLRSRGGVRIFTNAGLTAGVTLAGGGSAWAAVSDRNAKENFSRVNAREVLEKLAAMPIETWNYKSQHKTIRHMGPMAQDFAAAFGVGEDDKRITTIDADGVALAAIQGLHQIVSEKESEIASLRAEKDAQIADLSARLARLESFVNSITTSTGQKP